MENIKSIKEIRGYLGNNTEKKKEPRKNIEEKYYEILKQILLKGETIQEYISRNNDKLNEEDLKEVIRRLKVIVSNVKKEDGYLKPDENFLKVIKLVDGNLTFEMSLEELRNEIKEKKSGEAGAKIGYTSNLKAGYFWNNIDFMVYTLAKENFANEVVEDIEFFEKYRKQYNNKVEKYMHKLYCIDKRKRKNKTDNIVKPEEER